MGREKAEEGQGQSNKWVFREWEEQQKPGREERKPGLPRVTRAQGRFQEGLWAHNVDVSTQCRCVHTRRMQDRMGKGCRGQK